MAVVQNQKAPEEPRNLTFGPQRPRQGAAPPTKTVTFTAQPQVSRDPRYAPINARPPLPGYNTYAGSTNNNRVLGGNPRVPSSSGPAAIVDGTGVGAGAPKVSMQQPQHSLHQPRLSTSHPAVLGGVRVLPAHGRLPQVNIPPNLSSTGSSNGEDVEEDMTEVDSYPGKDHVTNSLPRDGYIVYGSSADQGRVRTSNV